MNLFNPWVVLDGIGHDCARLAVSTCWQSLIVFAAFGVLAFIVRSKAAAVRHAIWTAAVLSLPLIPAVSWLSAQEFGAKPIPVFPVYSTVVNVQPATAPEPAAGPIVSQSSGKDSPFRVAYPWAIIPLLYVAGAGICTIRIISGRTRVRRFIEHGSPVIDERVIDMCDDIRLRYGIKRQITVVETEAVPVPFTCRTLHPVIVLPAGFAEGLSDSELRAVIAHEAAHVRRYDTLVLNAVSVVRALFFFHPFVWLAAREISHLSEQASDTLVLEAAVTPLPYARLVARIAEQAASVPVEVEYAAGMIFSRTSFIRRMEAILAHREGALRKLSNPALAGVVLAGGIALAVAFALPIGEAAEKKAVSPVKPAVNESVIQVAQASPAKKAPSAPSAPTTPTTPTAPQAPSGPPALPATLSISGTVTDESGKPLEGALVDAWTFVPGPGTETRTDRQGRFTLGGFGPGQKVEIEFSKEDYSPKLFLKQDPGVSGLNVRLGNRTYFEGKVFGHEGKPVSHAWIRANRGPKETDGGVVRHIWTETKSGGDGSYRLYVEADTYDIQVMSPLAVGRIHKQSIKENEARKLDIRLQESITFRARVVDSLTGKPVQGIGLSNGQSLWIKGVSDARGDIAINGMLPGPIELDVDGNGKYARWWSDQVMDRFKGRRSKSVDFREDMDRLMFDIKPGMAPVTITVEQGVRITGRVVDPGGKPVAGATVDPALTGGRNSLSGDTRFSVETKPDGTFDMLIPSSREIEYNLMAHDGKYQEWRNFANGVAKPIKTGPGQVIEGVTIKLSWPASAFGTVVDKDGKPMAGFSVESRDADDMENRYYYPKAVTDEKGNFSLGYIRPGKHYITASRIIFPKGMEPKGSFATVDLKAGITVGGLKIVGYTAEDLRNIKIKPKKKFFFF